MSKFGNLGKVFYQWGGPTATFFTYTHFSHDIIAGLLAALLPLIREDLGIGYLQTGLLLSAYAITSGLFQFLGGWIGDRISRQIVMAIGLGGVGLTAIAVALTSAYYPMLAVLVIMGVLAGAYHPSTISMLAGCFEEARRGKALALHSVGGSIGFSAGPVLGGLIAAMLGWRFAFIFLSIPALVAVPIVLRKFRQQRQANGEELISQASTKSNTSAIPMPSRPSLWQVLRPVAIIIALAVFIQFVAGSAVAFMPLYLVDKHNIAPAHAAMMIGVIRGGGIVGCLLGGWLSDMWGRRNAIFLALVTTGPILYLLTKLPFNSVLMVIFVIFGIFMYMRQATIQLLLMDSTPPEVRATVFGIYFGLSMEGMSLVQPVAGHFMDIFGIVQVFNTLALITVALSIGALLLAVGPKLRR